MIDLITRLHKGRVEMSNVNDYYQEDLVNCVWTNISDAIESLELYCDTSTFSGHIEVIGLIKE